MAAKPDIPPWLPDPPDRPDRKWRFSRFPLPSVVYLTKSKPRIMSFSWFFFQGLMLLAFFLGLWWLPFFWLSMKISDVANLTAHRFFFYSVMPGAAFFVLCAFYLELSSGFIGFRLLATNPGSRASYIFKQQIRVSLLSLSLSSAVLLGILAYSELPEIEPWILKIKQAGKFAIDEGPYKGSLPAFIGGAYLGGSIILGSFGFTLLRSYRRAQGQAPKFQISELPICAGSREKCDLSIAHLSDLHLTSSFAAKLMSGGPSPNAKYAELLKRHSTTLEATDLILVTGDITDSGQGEEWRQFFELTPPPVLAKMVILPGNHDVNITSPSNLDAGEGIDQPLRGFRLIRALSAMVRVQGERVRVLDSAMGWVRLVDLYEDYARELDWFVKSPPKRLYRRTFRPFQPFLFETTEVRGGTSWSRRVVPRRVWHRSFPMVIECNGIRLWLFDSNGAETNFINNAFGQVSTYDLNKLSLLKRHLPKLPDVFALHHHVSLPPLTARDLARNHKRAQSFFLTMENACEFADAVNDGRRTVIFHGHRHYGFSGMLGEQIHILSAFSTTLGDERPDNANRLNGGFFIYDLVRTEDGGAAVRSGNHFD